MIAYLHLEVKVLIFAFQKRPRVLKSKVQLDESNISQQVDGDVRAGWRGDDCSLALANSNQNSLAWTQFTVDS